MRLLKWCCVLFVQGFGVFTFDILFMGETRDDSAFESQ